MISSTGFDLRPANINEAMQLATMISNSQLSPSSFKGKPEDTLVAMMLGNEIGLNPLQAIQNIAVINGRPSIWGDALLALVQNHPAFKSIEESFNDKAMTATCTVCRKNGKPHTSTFSQTDAENAGLWGKKGPWSSYPKRMLAMRARGFALRNQFADALLGLITTEEAQDITQDEDPEQAIPGVAIEQDEPAMYPQKDFDNNFDKWLRAIESGKKTADDIITTVSTKGQLTAEMKARIRGEK